MKEDKGSINLILFGHKWLEQKKNSGCCKISLRMDKFLWEYNGIRPANFPEKKDW